VTCFVCHNNHYRRLRLRCGLRQFLSIGVTDRPQVPALDGRLGGERWYRPVEM